MEEVTWCQLVRGVCTHGNHCQGLNNVSSTNSQRSRQIKTERAYPIEGQGGLIGAGGYPIGGRRYPIGVRGYPHFRGLRYSVGGWGYVIGGWMYPIWGQGYPI